MPELPDVEGFRRVLAEHGRGRRVAGVRVLDTSVLHDVTARALDAALSGCRFDEPDRLGKWLIARTDGPSVLIHFGMTGELVWCEPGAEGHRHDRVVVDVGDGELRYRDMRKLKGLWFAEDEAAVATLLAAEGPDALSLDREGLDGALSGSRRRLKAALMDQGTVAGLGNLLVDEILWRARLRPDRRGADLDAAERAALHREMRRVLRESVRAGRVPPRRSWLTGARDEPDPHCPRCGTALRRDRVGGRSTVWCPHCQDGS